MEYKSTRAKKSIQRSQKIRYKRSQFSPAYHNNVIDIPSAGTDIPLYLRIRFDCKVTSNTGRPIAYERKETESE